MSAATSSASSLNEALTSAVSKALAGLNGATPKVAIVFVSTHLGVSSVGSRRGKESLSIVVPVLKALLPNLQAVLGCGADGIIVYDDDKTSNVDKPGVSLTLLSLPNISVKSFHIMPDDLRTDSWKKEVLNNSKSASLIVLSDPTFASTGDLSKFLGATYETDPDIAISGAIASTGASTADGHMICTLRRDVLDIESKGGLRDNGLIGLSFEGDIELETLISPRVRSIGPVFTAADSAHGVLPELNIIGQPNTRASALVSLKSVIKYATPEERKLITNELHVGIANPNDNNFVIRNIGAIDVDKDKVAISSTDIKKGQSVRFFVKDSESTLSTLKGVLQKYKKNELANSLVGYSNPPFAALVFSDTITGLSKPRKVFNDRLVENKTLQDYLTGIPIAGFISGAQIAPPGFIGDPNDTSQLQEMQQKKDGKSVLQNAASVIVLMRRRSGISPLNPPESP